MTAGPALEMWSTQNVEGKTDGNTFTVVARRSFTVLIEASDSPEIAATAPGVPQLGELYPGSVFIFCESVSIDRVSPIMVIVSCTYQGVIGQDGNPASSPIFNEPSITWRSSTTDELIDQDFNGKPIVTKNNEPIEGLSERLTDDIAVIGRNYLTINRYALRAYRRATNSDVFLGWPAGTARIMDDEATAVFKNGIVQYWQVRATIQFREPIHTTPDKAWYKRVRHEGYYVRDTPSEEPHIAFDLKTKTPVTKKILLKADGTREDDPDNAHWLEFQTLGSLPFSALGLV